MWDRASDPIRPGETRANSSCEIGRGPPAFHLCNLTSDLCNRPSTSAPMNRISSILQIASYQFRPSPWTLPANGCKIATMISSPITVESKSIHDRGDVMNRSRDFRPRRVLARIAMLFGVMIVTLLPAYGQQEVNPTWFDPWPGPNAAHSSQHSSQPRAAIHRHQRTVRSVSSAPVAGRLRAKRATSRPSQS